MNAHNISRLASTYELFQLLSSSRSTTPIVSPRLRRQGKLLPIHGPALHNSPLPMQLNIPERFNAATYFIDRHINDRHINDRHMADGRAQKVAFECGDERVTYGDLYHRVNQAGNALRNLGVRREERIALLLLDTPDFAYCFFGGIKIGAVPVPINTMLKPAEYEYMLNDSRARIAIVSAELLPQISAIPRGNLEYLETIIVSRGQVAEHQAAEGMLSLQTLMDASPVELTRQKPEKTSRPSGSILPAAQD